LAQYSNYSTFVKIEKKSCQTYSAGTQLTPETHSDKAWSHYFILYHVNTYNPKHIPREPCLILDGLHGNEDRPYWPSDTD